MRRCAPRKASLSMNSGTTALCSRQTEQYTPLHYEGSKTPGKREV